MKHITKLLCILVFFSITSKCFAYTLTGYKRFVPYQFSMKYNYITDAITSANETQRIALTPIGLNFTFNTLDWELTVYPISLKSNTGKVEEISAFTQSIRWQVYRDLNIWGLRHLYPGLQLGVLNLGMPKSNFEDSSFFSEYLSGYYWMHTLNIKRLYFGFGRNIYESKNQDVIIIEYRFGNNSFYAESAYQQLFVGVSTELGHTTRIDIAFNTTSEANFENKFLPTFAASFKLKNSIYRRKQEKKRAVPLRVDATSFMNLEKGVLAFYDKDFSIALDHYEAVIEKYPYFGIAHVRLANAHYQLKNFYLAEKHWKLGLKYHAPNKSEILYYLSTIKERQYEETKLRHLPTETEVPPND